MWIDVRTSRRFGRRVCPCHRRMHFISIFIKKSTFFTIHPAARNKWHQSVSFYSPKTETIVRPVSQPLPTSMPIHLVENWYWGSLSQGVVVSFGVAKWATPSAFKHTEDGTKISLLCDDDVCTVHTIQLEWHFGFETVQLRATPRALCVDGFGLVRLQNASSNTYI